VGEAAVIEVKVEGLDELLQNLKTLAVEVQDKEVKGMVFVGARAVRDLAKGYLVNVHGAVDTGSLRDGIRVGFDRQNSSAVQKSYNVFVTNRVKKRAGVKYRKSRKGSAVSEKMKFQSLYYWRFLEFGTAKMRARPFLRPALDENKELVLGFMRERLEKGITRQARKMNKLIWKPSPL